MTLAALLGLAVLFLLFSSTASAHCPLCTAGIAAAGIGATWLGVDMAVVGVFVGGFAFAMGFWVSHWLGKEYIPYQDWLLAGGSFLLTVVPVLPMFPASFSIPVFLGGEYGSLLYRVYTVNKFLAGSVLGAGVIASTPSLSRRITAFRGETVPFQGTMLTVLLLVIAGAVVQGVVVWTLW